MTQTNTAQTKGLLFIFAGLLGCLFVGITFLLKLLITCFSLILIEYGLIVLRLPTLWQRIQIFILNLYRS